MRACYFLIKILCYGGLGLVLHLANVLITTWHYWAVIFIAILLDLFSGWLVLAELNNFIKDKK